MHEGVSASDFVLLFTMAIPVMNLLKTVGPLIVEAGRIVAGLHTAGPAARTEDRLMKLEQDMLRAGDILKGVAEQLGVAAQELRAQSEAMEALRQKVRITLVIGIVAMAGSLGALVAVIVRT